MFQLPIELQRTIYEFDNTYSELFLDCLLDIQYKIHIRHTLWYKHCCNNLIEKFRFKGILKQDFLPNETLEIKKNNVFNKLLTQCFFYYSRPEFSAVYSWWNKVRNEVLPEMIITR